MDPLYRSILYIELSLGFRVATPEMVYDISLMLALVWWTIWQGFSLLGLHFSMTNL